MFKVISKLVTFNVFDTGKYFLNICEKYVNNAVFPGLQAHMSILSLTVDLPTLETGSIINQIDVDLWQVPLSRRREEEKELSFGEGLS